MQANVALESRLNAELLRRGDTETNNKVLGVQVKKLESSLADVQAAMALSNRALLVCFPCYIDAS